MIIAKKDIKMVLPTAKVKTLNPVFDNVQVNPEAKTLTACNKASIYQVKVDPINPGEYPLEPGTSTALPELDQTVLVPANVLEGQVKGKDHNIPCLNSIHIGVTDENMVTLRKTDLESWDKKTVRQTEQEYPDVPKVIANCEGYYKTESSKSVVLSTAELELFVKTLESNKLEFAEIAVIDDTHPARVKLYDSDHQSNCTGYIMSYRPFS